ncbi:DinB family protein [Thalassospiraceae bacterium LMO-JJ14]|nr:DinB family protein [Thalassospiraceae bacterium LMO-JJ14]
MLEHLKLMARYNKWANDRISSAIAEISEADYMAPREAFFGSIHGAANHLLLVDRLWRGRMEGKPYPAESLDQIVCQDREAFIRERAREDDKLIDFVDGFDAVALEEDFSYKTMNGIGSTDKRRAVLAHIFNHATHHRGQMHALLSQVPSDPPPLDLIPYLRERNAEP